MHAVSDEEQRALAAWFVQHKRRWPLVLILATGMCASITTFAFGLGVAKARANLPKSTAYLLELKKPAPPPEQDAVPLWERAISAYVRWTGPDETDPLRSKEIDWRDDATYAPDGPIRAFLDSNAEALALADQAAALPEAGWKYDLEQGHKLELPFLSKQRTMTRLCALRARFAAHDNHWGEVLIALKTGRTAGMHGGKAPTMLSSLTAKSIDFIVCSAIGDILSLPAAQPDEQALDGLLAFCRDCYRKELPASSALEDEKRIWLMTLDLLISGQLNTDSGIRDTSPREIPAFAPMFNPLGFEYETDRAFIAADIDKKIARALEDEGNLDAFWIYDPETENDGIYATHRLEHFFGNKVLPIFVDMRNLSFRRRAIWRVAIAAIQACKYARAHDGQWPKKLSDLSLEPSERQDPCNPEGGQLHLRVDQNRVLTLWSVGMNGKDDGAPVDKSNAFLDEILRIERYAVPQEMEGGE